MIINYIKSIIIQNLVRTNHGQRNTGMTIFKIGPNVFGNRISTCLTVLRSGPIQTLMITE
jgi:hypothetical protein